VEEAYKVSDNEPASAKNLTNLKLSSAMKLKLHTTTPEQKTMTMTSSSGMKKSTSTQKSVKRIVLQMGQQQRNLGSKDSSRSVSVDQYGNALSKVNINAYGTVFWKKKK